MTSKAPLRRAMLSAKSMFVCRQCQQRFKSSASQQRSLSSTGNLRSIDSTARQKRSFRLEYFIENGSLDGTESMLGLRKSRWGKGSSEASKDYSESRARAQHLINSRRQDAQAPQDVARKARDKTVAPTEIPLSPSEIIPPDASSRLSGISSSMPKRSLRRIATAYLSLSKPRLTFLIVLTTATAYSLYPVPTLLLPSSTASPSLSTLTLSFLAAGTALSSSSANALNMLFEPKHDAKMSRTRNRPIVRGLVRPGGALIFAFVTGGVGLGALYYGVNPTTAFLSGLNIFLYAGVYTPMKRISVLNTWVGAIVGGIPPLMGWAAAAGQSAVTTGDWHELLFGEGAAGGWLLAALLFAWQFPHFNALSWTIRDEYKTAGYRMLCWTNSRMNGRVALRYSVLFFPICFGLTWAGVTDRGFLVTSSVANAWALREAWKFWRREGHQGSARGLFWASVWHLPAVLVLAMVHKQGLWERIMESLLGTTEEDEDDEDDEEWEQIEESPIIVK